MGYAVLDPETNIGEWKISGGANGSYFTGLFFGFMISLFVAAGVSSIVLSSGIAGPLLIPLLTAVFGHLALLSLLLVEQEGFDRRCFFGGLFAGLAPLGLVLIPFFGSYEAGIASILGILGYSGAVFDLDGTRSGCLTG